MRSNRILSRASASARRAIFDAFAAFARRGKDLDAGGGVACCRCGAFFEKVALEPAESVIGNEGRSKVEILDLPTEVIANLAERQFVSGRHCRQDFWSRRGECTQECQFGFATDRDVQHEKRQA
jgi:hypothetical protein